LIRINAAAQALGDHAKGQGLSVANSETRSRAEAPSHSGAQATPPGRNAMPYSENEFLTELGDRVRDTRLLRDMSRRELARKSGVSERYIAQIEAGKGNVSIMLLLRIAYAIRCG
jgi:ribosome-binding protein aMBF1 (putative translation factor)